MTTYNMTGQMEGKKCDVSVEEAVAAVNSLTPEERAELLRMLKSL